MSTKDNARAWLVCVGAFVTYFLETGVIKSLGVMLPVLRQQFATETWVVGLIISLVLGFGSVTCILSSALQNRFSARKIMMTYGILSSIGLVVASVAENVYVLALSLTLLGFAYGAESVITFSLPEYFDKYYDTAVSIAHAGLSIGVMVMPLVIQLSLDLYGWRGTMLLVSAINSFIIVCAVLLRSPINNDSKEYLPLIETKKDKEQLEGQKITWQSRIIKYLSDMLLIKNLDFICLVLIYTAQGYFYTGWLIYLVPHTIDCGYTPYKASALATVGGVANFAGTMFFPIAAKLLSAKYLLYLSTLTAAFALAIDPIMSYLHSYGGLAFATSLLNIAYAIGCCTVFKQLLKVVDKQEITNAVNWLFVGYGLGSVLSGFWSGWLFDVFGKYTASYLVLSAVTALSIGPLLVMDIIDVVMGIRYHSLPSTDCESNMD